MKRIMSQLKKKGGTSPERYSATPPPMHMPQGDNPEAVVVREISAFCNSGAPDSVNAGDEYLHLPAIVDAAESSPYAAREAASTIRQYLSKDYYTRGYAQYNAIMLTRILTDNPGRPFTQFFDHKFVSTVKELLREGRDSSVQQILRETLDYIEAEKSNSNETVGLLIEMWRKEKGKSGRIRQPMGVVFPSRQPGPQYPPRAPRGLPPPDELAARIEEAKTTSRLLLQTIQSTPQQELPYNELVKEFADRAQAAHKSVQQYMNCENPRPDENTMLTLIETNDELNIAMSKHQRALLQARKAAGLASPSPQPQGQERNSYSMPQHVPGQNVYDFAHPQQHQQPPRPSSNSYAPPMPPRQPQATSQPPVPQANNPPSTEFAPPPGPPPVKRTSTYEMENAYAAPESPPRVPPRKLVSSEVTQPTNSSSNYGVAENPFSDDAYAADPTPAPSQLPSQQPQQSSPKQYSLFDRAKHHINTARQSHSQPQTQPSELSSESAPVSVPPTQPQRPGSGYQPTPSYLHRQESSANNMTMHGGSPPPPDASGVGNAPAQTENTGGGVNGVERQMGGLRVV